MSLNAYRQRSPSPLQFSSSEDELSDADSLSLTPSPSSSAVFQHLQLATSTKQDDEHIREIEMETSDVEAWMTLAKSTSSWTSPTSSPADISMKSISSPDGTDHELDDSTPRTSHKRKRRRIDSYGRSDLDSADEADHETETKRSNKLKGKRPRRGTLERDTEGVEAVVLRDVNVKPSRYGDISRSIATNRRVPRKVTVSKITEGVETLGPFIASTSFHNIDAEASQVEASEFLQKAPASPSASPPPDTSSIDRASVARLLFQDDMLASYPSQPPLLRPGAGANASSSRIRRTRRKARQNFNAHSYTAADPFVVAPIRVNVIQSDSMVSIHAPSSLSRFTSMESVHNDAIDQDVADASETDLELEVCSKTIKKARTRYRPVKPLSTREIILSGDEQNSLLRCRKARKDKSRSQATSHLQRSSPTSIVPTRSAGDWRRIRASYKRLKALAGTNQRHCLKAHQHATSGQVFTVRATARREARNSRREMLASVKDLGRERWEARVGNWGYCDVVRDESWSDWPWLMSRKWTVNDSLVPEHRRSLEVTEVAAPETVSETQHAHSLTRAAELEETDPRPAKRQAPAPAPIGAAPVPAINTLRVQAAQRRAQRERFRRVREDATRRRIEQEEAERFARETEVRRLAEAAAELERASLAARSRRPASPPPAYVSPIPIRASQPLAMIRLPSYLPNRYTRFTPSPPPPYNAQTDRQVQIPARYVADGETDQAMDSWFDTVPAVVGGWPTSSAVVRRLEAEAEAELVDIEAGPSSVSAAPPHPFDMVEQPQANGWNEALELEEGEGALAMQDEEDEMAAANLVMEMEDREREREQSLNSGLLSRVRSWLRRW